MIEFLLPALLAGAAPGPCAVPESMPTPSERVAGEGDDDWCLQGDDILAVAGPDARPLRQVALAENGLGVSQVMQWRRGAPDPVATGWQMMYSRPATQDMRSDFNEILYQRLGDHIIAVTVNPAWRIGNAVCAGEGGAFTAYLPSGVKPSELDHQTLDGVEEALAERDPGNIMCTLLIRDSAGYGASFRGPQGRPLYDVDSFYVEAVIRIVPPGNLNTLLGVNR